MPNDFIPNHLSFDAAACTALIKKIYDLYLNDLSAQLVAIVQKQIFDNGNGSTLMRLSAAAEVRETKREITDDEICLEVGIDTALLKRSENVYVRVMVVLHGNQADGPLMTKPGQATWSKHVLVKRLSSSITAHPLPGEFNQYDKETDIVSKVESNISKQTTKYLNAYVRNVKAALDSIDWSAFVKVS